MKGLHVIFRADASRTIGSGHVMRCLTLADALRKGGADVLFVCRGHPGNLRGPITARGHAVVSLPMNTMPIGNDGSQYASWLGADWQADARETGKAIAAHWGEPADWLIVDHYAIDAQWEAMLRPHAHRVMVIDDLADRHHDCDVLLDHNLVAGFEDRYEGLIPETCTRLLGPDYALLGPEYAELHTKPRQRGGTVRTILVSFGGADPLGLTEKAVRAFLSLERPDIRLDVVIGRMAPSLPAIRTLAREHGNITIHSNLPSLAPLMAKADLAIGAAGTTSWERLCLGLPAIVATIADNQRPIATELARQGLASWINENAEADTAQLSTAVAEALASPPQSDVRHNRVVDGQGTQRVLRAMMREQRHES